MEHYRINKFKIIINELTKLLFLLNLFLMDIILYQ